MATAGQDADLAFFNLMHHFLATSPKGENGTDQNKTGSERRCGLRRPFRLTQRIAPGYCWEVPPVSAWIGVCCYDLAQGGFSFFLDEKPTFQRLVARFQSAESIYLAARVVHWRPVLVDSWGGVIESDTISTVGRAGLKFLVGCQFMQRFEP